MVVTGCGAAVWCYTPQDTDSKVPITDEAKFSLENQWASFQSINEGFLTGGWVLLPQQVTPGKPYHTWMRVEPLPLILPRTDTLSHTLRPRRQVCVQQVVGSSWILR